MLMSGTADMVLKHMEWGGGGVAATLFDEQLLALWKVGWYKIMQTIGQPC
jgi:hypothetical protein